jgi:transcriptional regulator with PAS, ATPase and Fis domain
MNEGRATLGELITTDNRRLMANIIPIDVGETVKGAMITIEDVGQIVEMEAAIRSESYRKGLSAHYRFEDILGSSAGIIEVKRIAREYAAIDATVLISGASGTGKELYAQSLHNASRRRQRPFVAVNCGAIPSSLLESELFGYVEGAFTGAHKKGKPGLFELAHGGTIFLDEIGEMDKVGQTSLLRVIQERRVMRLGGDKSLPIDVRIIAATNRNLRQLVSEGTLREDLFYRINVLPLELPSLRECPGDALFIAEHFLDVYNKIFGRRIVLNERAKLFIGSYEWPGNVRELRNYIERLVVTAREDLITAEAAERILGPADKGAAYSRPAGSKGSEKQRIINMLGETKYNQKEAAKRLGINRSTLYRKLKSLNIEINKLCSS